MIEINANIEYYGNGIVERHKLTIDQDLLVELIEKHAMSLIDTRCMKSCAVRGDLEITYKG